MVYRPVATTGRFLVVSKAPHISLGSIWTFKSCGIYMYNLLDNQEMPVFKICNSEIKGAAKEKE